MDNHQNLSKLPDLEPNQLVVEQLEKMLERAKSGEIRSIGGFYEVRGIEIVTYAFGLATNKFEAVGHLEVLKHELISRMVGTSVD